MSSTATYLLESKEPITGSWMSSGPKKARTTSTPGLVFSFEMPSPKSAMARKHNKFADLVSKLEASPASAATLADARKTIAETYCKDAPVTLKTLRLKAGLSQQGLAQAVRTSQPHIANIENGKQNIMFETAGLLSKALGVSLDELFSVWEASRKHA